MESPTDHECIAALVAAAFLDHPHSDLREHLIVAALRARARLSLSLVAEHGREIVGHVAASPVSISDGSRNWFGIAPLSVARVWRRQGIAARLMHTALKVLRTRSAGGCVLLGEPQYYQRFAFAPCPALVLPGVPAKYFQILAFNDQLPVGEVAYDAAFQLAGAAQPDVDED